MFCSTLKGQFNRQQMARLSRCTDFMTPVMGSYTGTKRISMTSKSRSTRSRFAYPEDMPAYEDDWSEKPEYPKIDPETHTWNQRMKKQRQDKLDWHAKIRKASCPEAKNLEYNLPRQYGYKVMQMKEDSFDYDSQAAYRFVTRTHIASNNQLPSQYSTPEMNEKVEYFKQKVKEPLKDVIAFELDSSREFEQDFNAFPHTNDLKRSQALIPQINRVMLSVLGSETDHLKDCQVDVQPRVESFWQMYGQQPTTLTRKRRKGNIDLPERSRYKAKHIKEDDPAEVPLHYVGSTLLQVRCKDPPQNFVSESDVLCQRTQEIPDQLPQLLTAFGFKHADDYRFASIIPGHWSGDEHRCNLLAYHPRHHLKHPDRMSNPYWSAPEENEDALFSQAMMTSFGRLVSQAFYHGFDQFTDIEYPFSTQTIITNGLDWSFFAYQMNTMSFSELFLSKNQKQNVMWGTQTQSIYDKEKQGELNDEVVGNLIRFYLNQPKKISAVNPTPYLGKKIQDWVGEDEEMNRIMTFYNFRRMVAQVVYITDDLIQFRPPEIYEWERIYKVTFKTMPLEARRRYFELPPGFPGYNPYLMPYRMMNPVHETKGIRRQRALLAEKKEKEAVEAAKRAERLKYGLFQESENE